MAEEVLKIKVGADVSQATKGLKELDTAVKTTGKEFGKLNPAVSRSTQVFTNFGRIAQDAAYGPMAIANNIEPLILSLQQLRREGGSSKDVFKALGASLLGGGGLVLAFSALTFAMSGGLSKMKEFLPGFKELAKEQKKAAEAAQKHAEAQRQSAVNLEKQRVELDSLVKVAKGDVGTKEQQAAALEKLNKLIPDHVGVLTQQNIKTAEGTRIVLAYVKALEAQATAEAIISKVADLNVQRISDEAELRQTLAPLMKEQLELSKKLASQRKIEQGVVGGSSLGVSGGGSAAIEDDLFNVQERIKNTVAAFSNGRKLINKELELLRGQIDTAVAESVVLDMADPKKVKEKAAKAKKDIEDVFKSSPVILPIETEILPTSGLEIATGKVKTIFEQLNLKKANTELALPGATQGAANVDLLRKSLEGSNKELKYSQDLVNAIGGVFQSAFDAALISGQNFFRVFLDGIKNLIAKLIAAAAAAAILAAILSAVGGGGGASFGTTFKGLFGSFSGMKGIGGVAAPSSVGGPSVAAASARGGEVVVRMHGQELIGVINRTNTSNRVNG